MKPHKHADILKAIAENSEVQIEGSFRGEWIGISVKGFFDRAELEPWIFRIKPGPKPDVVSYLIRQVGDKRWLFETSCSTGAEIKLTRSGETGKLINVELI